MFSVVHVGVFPFEVDVINGISQRLMLQKAVVQLLASLHVRPSLVFFQG